MEYKNLKEHLEKFDKILVSGPQRSGTRIATKIISNDLDLDYYQEDKIGVYSIPMTEELINDPEEKFALQCPAASHALHKLANESVAVVFMRRSVIDIKKSEKRIEWSEKNRNIEYTRIEETFAYPDKREIPVSQLKYRMWDSRQKNAIKYAFDLEYYSLSNHDLFVPKEKREDFGTSDTEIKE